MHAAAYTQGYLQAACDLDCNETQTAFVQIDTNQLICVQAPTNNTKAGYKNAFQRNTKGEDAYPAT